MKKMGSITLEQLHQDLQGLKKEIEDIKTILEENFELKDDVVDEIKASRKTKLLISHDAMRDEFGSH